MKNEEERLLIIASVYEAKVIKTNNLIIEEKELKARIKNETAQLYLKTKDVYITS